MGTPKAELLFHPLRMRIILAVSGRRMTARQLGEALGDVSPATLYHHLRLLTGAGILAVVEERPVRGTVERVYALPASAASLDPAELAHAGRDDLMRYFTTFVASLLGDFARYLERERIDFVADGVGFRQIVLELSDEEFVRFARKRQAVVLEFLANPPAPGRTRRLLSTVVMPAEAEFPDEESHL